MRHPVLASLIWLIASMLPAMAQNSAYDVLRIYVDADQTGARSSGVSIVRGLNLALEESDHVIAGMPVEVVSLDHRGNSRRSLNHLQQYLQDPNALILFSGLHSPPLLAHKHFINKNRILTLDPWAAAGPITRTDGDNYIFRLSIDDQKAGAVIVNAALAEGFSAPGLLLEDTGWGRSNEQTMNAALKKQSVSAQAARWFRWGLSENTARIILRDIKRRGADVLFLVANAAEGKTIARAMLSLPENERLPIRSHWGITGGDFPETLGDSLQDIDLKFIQTNFSFLRTLPQHADRLLQRLINKYDDLEGAQDIKAVSGLVHSYDLMTIARKAVEQIQLTGDIHRDRYLLRQALENLNGPVEGLMKRYNRPFSNRGVDAHEALDSNDFVMGYYDQKGVRRLVEPR